MVERLVESCQYLYYKVACKIRDEVEIKEIAEFIGKSELEAELWMLKFIRSRDIDAKLNSTKGTVISNKETQGTALKYAGLLQNMNSFINKLEAQKYTN